MRVIAISSKEVTVSNSWVRRLQMHSTISWRQRNPRNVSLSIMSFIYIIVKSELISIRLLHASVCRTACNSYLYGRALLRLRVESSSSTGYRERHRQEQRAYNVYTRPMPRWQYMPTAYRNCVQRLSKVPRFSTIRVLPFFFSIAHRHTEMGR